MTAEDIVARQLDAYNARDIDVFMACWSANAQMFSHPDTLLAAGHDQIRARHLVRFQEPDLDGKLVSRTVIGDRVIDREVVTRTFPQGKGELDVVAIYEVLGGLITRAWFITGEPTFSPPLQA
ncbi:MAG: nuclear transport factor 2 family protein [Asticcacaulis sp.]